MDYESPTVSGRDPGDLRESRLISPIRDCGAIHGLTFAPNSHLLCTRGFESHRDIRYSFFKYSPENIRIHLAKYSLKNVRTCIRLAKYLL